MPPCPGIIFPESFKLYVLFNKLSTKSPSVPVITMMNAITIYSLPDKLWKYIDVMYPAVRVNRPPPINPSHDFLGDILSNNLLLPIVIPTRYAKVSLLHCKIK